MKKHTPVHAAYDASATLARELYDAVMGEIEPELTTEMIPALEELHEDETPEQTKHRAKHYAWAFEQFFLLWNDVVEEVFGQLEQVKHALLARARKDTEEVENLAMHEIEEKLRHL